MDELLDDPLGRFVRDLLDVDATVLARHQHRPLRGAIEDDAEIELAGDAEPLLDEHALDHLAVRAGLVGDELHANHVGGRLLGGVRALDDLDSAALPAATGVNLGFDDDRSATQPNGDGLRLGCVEHDFTLRDRHAVRRKNRLGLIFVDFHEALSGAPIVVTRAGLVTRVTQFDYAQSFNHISLQHVRQRRSPR